MSLNYNDDLYWEKKYLKYKAKYHSEKKNLIDYIKEKSALIDSGYNSNIFFNQHDLNKLDIKDTYDNIKGLFERVNYIQLRPYNGEKTLLIGCGNIRLDCGNLHKCDTDSEKLLYDNYHTHENTYTIDPALVANPSIVSYFKNGVNFFTIPDHSFDLIIFEGGGDPSMNSYEIQRLLKNTTNTFCIKMTEGRYDVYSYYFEGQYFVN